MYHPNNPEVSDGGFNNMRPVAQGSSLLIQGLPSGPKPYEEVLTFLRKGNMLQKYGRHGNPKFHHFRLGAEDTELQWVSKGGRTRGVALSVMKRFQRGQETDVFKRYPQPSKAFFSFSIIYDHTESGKERSLDVICPNHQDFEIWYWGVQVVKAYPPAGFNALMGPRPDVGHRSRGQVSTGPPSLENIIRSSDGPLSNSGRPTKNPPLAASSTGTAGAGPLQGSGGLFASQDQGRRIGDLFVWGSLAVFDENEALSGQPPGKPCTCVDPMQSWQQPRCPALVHNTGGLNVTMAACGTRHATLISRAGELYTWGYGRGGALGHGSLLNLCAPQRVEGRWVQAHEAVQSASASDSATAAITSAGNLYTWGTGSAGQLGHGDVGGPVTQPKLVRTLADAGLKVAQVSCGPYHTAAITCDGSLYTWGSGLFGRLGHGDTASCFLPRRVAALDDQCVLSVACGWWHTAAVVSPRSSDMSRMPSQATSPNGRSMPLTAMSAPICEYGMAGVSMASGGPQELGREASVATTMSDSDYGSVVNSKSRLNDSRDRWMEAVQGGGTLYTWGGDLSWMEAKDVREACKLAAKRGPLAMGALESPTHDSVTSGPRSELKLLSPGKGISDAVPLEGSSSGTHGDGLGCESANGVAVSEVVPPPSAASDAIVMKSNKRDHHKGCLGVGDLYGRLTPTRVGGDLEHRHVTQVACGWNLTVVLTQDGHVFQMGATGAYNSDEEKGKQPPAWEGARLPTQVDGALFGLYIEEVAVGMHHVAAVASRLANGRLLEERRSRLLMWGQGRAGQLGLEGSKDCNMPQIVPQVDGRRILQVACGGNHTLTVCEHDHSRDAHKSSRMVQLSNSQKEFSVPSPPGSLINGLGGTTSGTGAMTPRMPSVTSLAATGVPRQSYPPPMRAPTGLRDPGLYGAMVPSASAFANVAASVRASLPTAAGNSTVSQWLGTITQTVGTITNTVGTTVNTFTNTATTALGRSNTANANSSSHHHHHSHHQSLDNLRSSAEAHRHVRASQSGHMRVIAMSSMARREAAGLSDGAQDISDSGRRRARLGRHVSNLGASGPLPQAGRNVSGHLSRSARRGLSSHASSSALSTQSSPGLVGAGRELDGPPSSGRASPTSSVSGFDPQSDYLLSQASNLTSMAAATSVAAAQVGEFPYHLSGRTVSAPEGTEHQSDYMAAARAQSVIQVPSLQLQSDLSGIADTNSTCTTPGFTPQVSPMSALNPMLHNTPEAANRQGSPANNHNHMNGNGSAQPWISPPRHMSSGGEGADELSPFSAPNGACRAEIAAYGDRDGAQGPLAAWHNGAPSGGMHVVRYGPDDDAADGNEPQRLTHSHSFLGRPLALIAEQGSDGEGHPSSNTSINRAARQESGPLGLQNAFELSLCYTSGGAQATGTMTPDGRLSLGGEEGGLLLPAPPVQALGVMSSAEAQWHGLEAHNSNAPESAQQSFTHAPNLTRPHLLAGSTSGSGMDGAHPSLTQRPHSMVGVPAVPPHPQGVRTISLVTHTSGCPGSGTNSPHAAQPGSATAQHNQMFTPPPGSPAMSIPMAGGQQQQQQQPATPAGSGPGSRSSGQLPIPGGFDVSILRHASSGSATGGGLLNGASSSPTQIQHLAAAATGGDVSANIAAHNVALQRQVVELQRRLDAVEQAAMQGSSAHPPRHHTRHMRHMSAIHLPASTSLPPHLLQDMTPALLQGLHQQQQLGGTPTVSGQYLGHSTSVRAPREGSMVAASGPSVIRIGSHRLTSPSATTQSPSVYPLPDLGEDELDHGSGAGAANSWASNPAATMPYPSPVPTPPGPHHSGGGGGAGGGGSDADGEEGDVEGGDTRAPLVQLQHPFASAVTTSPGGVADSVGSASSSVAGVVQAVGPAMLRTKAATILESRHRRAQSVDVSRLSLAVSSPTSTHVSSHGFQTMQAPLPPSWGRAASMAQQSMYSTLDAPLSHARVALYGTSSATAGPGSPAARHALQVTGEGGSGGIAARLSTRMSTSAGGSSDPSTAGAAMAAIVQGLREGDRGTAAGTGSPSRMQHNPEHHTQQPQPVQPQQQQQQQQQAQSWIEELWPGVYAYVTVPAPGAPPEIWKMKFSRRVFTEAQGVAWWEANKHLVLQRYPVKLRFAPGQEPPASQQPGPSHSRGHSGGGPEAQIPNKEHHLSHVFQQGGGPSDGGSPTFSPNSSLNAALTTQQLQQLQQQAATGQLSHHNSHHSLQPDARGSGNAGSLSGPGSNSSPAPQARHGLPPLPAARPGGNSPAANSPRSLPHSPMGAPFQAASNQPMPSGHARQNLGPMLNSFPLTITESIGTDVTVTPAGGVQQGEQVVGAWQQHPTRFSHSRPGTPHAAGSGTDLGSDGGGSGRVAQHQHQQQQQYQQQRMIARSQGGTPRVNLPIEMHDPAEAHNWLLAGGQFADPAAVMAVMAAADGGGFEDLGPGIPAGRYPHGSVTAGMPPITGRPSISGVTVSVQGRARPGHYRSRSGGPLQGGRNWG